MNHLICQIEAISDFAANLVRQDHCDDEEVILILNALRAAEDSLSHELAIRSRGRARYLAGLLVRRATHD
jgi:hypothetical protein